MRIEQINNDLTKIEIDRNNMHLVHGLIEISAREMSKIGYVKERENFYEFAYQGSFSETVNVIELINKIHLFNAELNRLLNK